MKKIIFTLTVLAALMIAAAPVFSMAAACNTIAGEKNGSVKKNVVSIGSNRVPGEMELRFTNGKAGTALITIMNEAGKIVLQQTSQLTGSANTIAIKKAIGLTEGAYSVQLVFNREAYTAKFMIWK